MEHKPEFYLEDTVISEGKEKYAEWNLDKEFGPGTAERLEKHLRMRIWNSLQGQVPTAAKNFGPDASYYRILTGKFYGDKETQGTIVAKLREFMETRKDVVENLWSGEAVARVVLAGEHWSDDGLDQTQVEVLQKTFPIYFEKEDYEGAIQMAYLFRILAGKHIASDEQIEKLTAILIQSVQKKLQDREFSDDTSVVYDAAELRILRAHEIRLIPGQGIEIVDSPPQEFEQHASALPETRNF